MLPLYLEQLTISDIKIRCEQLLQLLEECRICPRECLAKRNFGECGDCHATNELIVSNIGPHFGEEPPLVGTNGSGTIFFAHCNLSCEFCQNYDISHFGSGSIISTAELTQSMLQLQNRGCHNINLVSPTHYSPQIVIALISAIEKGLEIPLVYNCGGYESVETLQLLEGIIDIYMPDIKYSNNVFAEKFSNAANYWEVVTAAVKEMHRQVGDLKISKRGIAQRGLLIRHLVLPNNLAGSEEVLKFVVENISTNSYINIMDQYHPAYKAYLYPELSYRIKSNEYTKIILSAEKLGLYRGFRE